MSIIESDYFINVIEYLPMEQLMQMRLVCGAIDKFIAILSKNTSIKHYILRHLGVAIDTDLTMRGYKFYYWSRGEFFDKYEVVIRGDQYLITFNDKIVLFKNTKFIGPIGRKSYNSCKIIKKIFETCPSPNIFLAHLNWIIICDLFCLLPYAPRGKWIIISKKMCIRLCFNDESYDFVKEIIDAFQDYFDDFTINRSQI